MSVNILFKHSATSENWGTIRNVSKSEWEIIKKFRHLKFGDGVFIPHLQYMGKGIDKN
jgi:hypothetical protein